MAIAGAFGRMGYHYQTEKYAATPQQKPAGKVKTGYIDTELKDGIKNFIEQSGKYAELKELYGEFETNRIITIACGFNIHNVSDIIDFGSEIQANIAKAVDVVVDDYRSDGELDVGNDIIADIVNRAKSLDLAPVMSTKKWMRFIPFTKTRDEKLKNLEMNFNVVSMDMDDAADIMVDMMDKLLYRIDALEEIYTGNMKHIQELDVLIIAGEIRLSYTTYVQLKAAHEQHAKMKDPILLQKISDIERAIESLERKIIDLRTTRISVIQTAPQLRIVQSNNRSLVEKIHTTIMTIIPLWKKQFVIAMSLLEQQDATEVSKAIRSSMNTIIRENSNLLRNSGIDLQKEMSSEMIGVDTLQHIQESLVNVIGDTFTVETPDRHIKRANLPRPAAPPSPPPAPEGRTLNF